MSLPKKKAQSVSLNVDNHIALLGVFPGLAYYAVVNKHPSAKLPVIFVEFNHDCLLSDKKSRPERQLWFKVLCRMLFLYIAPQRVV